MPLCLVRIDDRLIHGQVSVAWVKVLSPDRIVVADDKVAATGWERDAYLNAAPRGLKVTVLSLAGALDFLRTEVPQDEKVILLTSSPADLLKLVEGGLNVKEVNVGGVHFREGRRKLLPYLYLDSEDEDSLRGLAKRGIRLEARDVPTAKGIDVISLVEEPG
jgi:PTS system mannose-specific IIB component